MKHLLLFIFTIFAFDISACTPLQILIQPVQMQSETGIETLDEVYLEPGETNAPVETPVPVLTFEATTYQDDSTGFEFDYPAGWTIDGGEGQDRGYYVQFYSWDWNPSEPTDPLPAGETKLFVTVQFWDPTTTWSLSLTSANWPGMQLASRASQQNGSPWQVTEWLCNLSFRDTPG